MDEKNFLRTHRPTSDPALYRKRPARMSSFGQAVCVILAWPTLVPGLQVLHNIPWALFVTVGKRC
eukprot:COSAG02_NODE_5342_length_4415_cov_3.398285_6_plen_65_part_00